MAGTKGAPGSTAGNRGKSTKPERKLTIPFENNAIAAVLFGEFDANLAVLEARLGVEAVAHGNLLSLSGPEDACDLARTVLEGLYARAQKGQPVTPADMEGAIRIAAGRAEAGTVKDASSPVSSGGKGEIRTRRKLVAARTAMQGDYIRALEQKDLVLASGIHAVLLGLKFGKSIEVWFAHRLILLGIVLFIAGVAAVGFLASNR